MALYIQYRTFGLRPQVLPNAILHCHNTLVALVALSSTCLFEFNLLSRMTPKYITSYVNLTSIPKSVCRFGASTFRFLVKSMSPVLCSLTVGPASQHQFSTKRNTLLIKELRVSPYSPDNRIAMSSA